MMDTYIEFVGTVRASGGVRCNISVQVRLEFDESDPFAIRMVITQQDDEIVEWMFSRELMMRGCTSPEVYGDADVRFQAVQDAVMVCLRSPEGHADLRMPAGPVTAFLARTTDLVEVGLEDVGDDLDCELAKILEDS